MYFNNIHIMIYVAFAIVGMYIGHFMAWVNHRLPEDKKVFSKEYFTEKKNMDIKGVYIMMVAVAVTYIALLYKFGLNEGFVKNLDLIKYLILTPMLISSFYIDMKHRILPNRLNMTIFETGIVLTFIYGINNFNIAKDMLLGMLTGGVIFLVIALLGGCVAGKEAMGLGDVKFMGAIGFYYGAVGIAEVSLLAFIVAAVVSILIIIYRSITKSGDEYMPFGPFLSSAAIAMIFIPANTVITAFISFCAWLSNSLLKLGGGGE